MNSPRPRMLFAGLWMIATATAAAQEPAAFGADLPALLRWVDDNNPELRVIGSEAEAARARVVPAGALADPMFQLELRDIPRDSPNVLPSQVGSTKYTISQALPWWGKRDLRREMAEADARAAGGRVQETRIELHARLKTAFAQSFAAGEAALITGSVLGLASDLQQVVLSRYANGLVPQQDVIKAQMEQTALRGELIRLGAEARQARARLNAILGRAVDAPLAPPASLGALPAAPFEAAALEARALQANPQILTQEARIGGAQRGRELARKNWYPDFNLAFSSIQRGSRLDAWEAMFELNIPLQRETRRAQESEAAATLAAAQARRQEIGNRLLGELGEAVAGFNAALEQERLLRDTLLPQAELTLRSARASYETGKVDFATLLDAQRQIRQARLDMLRARVEQRTRLADIERLIGEE